MKRVTLLLCLLAMSGVRSAAIATSWFDGSAAPAALQAAHRAYLRGDKTSAARQLIDFLRENPAAPARDNALALWRELNETIALPAQWKSHATLSRLRLVQRRSEKAGEVLFQFELQGDFAAASSDLRSLALLDSHGKLLLDRTTGLGQWRASRVKRVDLKSDFQLRSAWGKTPLPEDIYGIRVARADGPVSEDWVIVTGLAAQTAPVVLAPTFAQRLSDRSPVARWLPLPTTSDKSELELRVLRLAAPNGNFEERLGPWWGAFPSPVAKELRIGTRYQAGLGFGEPELQDGDYALRVAYTRVAHFGPTELASESARLVPFQKISP